MGGESVTVFDLPHQDSSEYRPSREIPDYAFHFHCHPQVAPPAVYINVA
jgi:hypothetical protein